MNEYQIQLWTSVQLISSPSRTESHSHVLNAMEVGDKCWPCELLCLSKDLAF